MNQSLHQNFYFRLVSVSSENNEETEASFVYELLLTRTRLSWPGSAPVVLSPGDATRKPVDIVPLSFLLKVSRKDLREFSDASSEFDHTRIIN